MIYHQYKAVQLHIGKTGGTSVAMAFGYTWNDIVAAGMQKHCRPSQIIKVAGKNVWKSYFKFSFVRNPWDRFVSKFHYERGHRKSIPWETPFKDYLSRWAATHPSFNQLNWFEGRIDEFEFVGRFERLHEDFRFICRQINADVALPHRLKTNHRHYSFYYDDQARDMIAKLAQADLEYFGYEFENQD